MNVILKVKLSKDNQKENGRDVYNLHTEDYDRFFMVPNCHDQEDMVKFIKMYMDRSMWVYNQRNFRLKPEDRHFYSDILNSGGVRIIDSRKVMVMGWKEVGLTVKNNYYGDYYELTLCHRYTLK